MTFAAGGGFVPRHRYSPGTDVKMHGRLLGVDLGTKRIGLALGEPDRGVVSPLKVLPARPTPEANAQAIVEAAEEYDVGQIVVGLPLNMDGSEGPQARLSRALAATLRKITSKPVHLHDERLTSFAADRRLAERNLTRKKKKARQDAFAAAILLEAFLERKT